ncbi:unnamed protein product [Litomosoides sigmodontis]|uniref:Uncharacterized protein n=1 Tax=Litomosoides sigmodontis TaxID=42156 RepID=A0A3P6UN43_LITSI|nr:unnamed protein product [Litomosoides sigmodontis]
MEQKWTGYYCGATTDGETALHCAAARGHVDCVQSLLDAGAAVDSVDQTGQTALHLALRRSHIDIALLLITKGCKLDVQDENGDTALHIASRVGLLSAVQTLCHLGAVVDIVNQHKLYWSLLIIDRRSASDFNCYLFEDEGMKISVKLSLNGR